MSKSAAVKAGEAYVEVTARDKGLQYQLTQATARLQKFGAALRAIGSRAFLGSAAIFAGLGLIFKNTLTGVADLQDMADRLGAPIDALSKLKYAAEQSGASMEDMEVAAKKMQDNLINGSDGFAKLGLNAEELLKLPLLRQFEIITAALNRVDNAAERTSLTLDIFGKSGTKLIPMLGEFGSLIERAKLVGDVIDPKDAENAAKADDLLNDTWKTMKSVVREVVFALVTLVGTLKPYIDIVIQVVAAVRQWMATHQSLVAAISLVVIGIVSFVGVLAAATFVVGSFVGSVAAIFTAITALIPLLPIIAKVGLALAGVGVFVAAIATVIALGITAFIKYTETGQWCAEQVMAAFGMLKQVLGGIVDALSVGDFALAWQIVLATCYTELMRFQKNVMSIWLQITTGVKLLWNDITTAIAKALVQIVQYHVKAIQALISVLPAKLRPNLGLKEFNKDLNGIKGVLEESSNEYAADQLENYNKSMEEYDKQFTDSAKYRDMLIKQANEKAAAAQAPTADKKLPPLLPLSAIGKQVSSQGAFMSSNFRQLLGGFGNTSPAVKEQQKTNDILGKIYDEVKDSGFVYT